MNQKLDGGKIGILLLTVFGVLLFCIKFVRSSTTITLLITGTVLIIVALFMGIKWKEIEDDIYSCLKSMFPSILILLSVGMLIGTWMTAGTIPVMVYYGMKILSPGSFLVMACIICATMSVMAGTSWGTIGTVGIALMGVSTGLGIPLHYTAGAVVVGAIFGDKMSPLSDTTVMASGVSDVEVVDHIKHMLYTTVPGLLISLILYFMLGLKFKEGIVGGESYELIMKTLENSFNLNPVLLLPPVVVLVLIYLKKPTLPVFTVGIILGAILAVVFQGSSLNEIANALNRGFTSSTGVKVVDKMVLRGGLKSMMGTVALLIAAGILGAPLRTTGIIGFILDKIKNVAAKGSQMMAGTFFVHGLMFLITGSYYVTFAVIGPVVKPLFDKYGLDRKNLSRMLEDTGTALAPIVPWSITGAFIAGTLEVPTMDYFLYAPMTYLGMVFSLIYIFTGIAITKTDGGEADTLSAVQSGAGELAAK